MAKRQRISATELGHMLDRPDRPVYVLSNEGVIVYYNEACRQWLGPGGEGLLGRRCAYHSSPEVSGPEAVAAALCPPPTVFSGQEASASICRVDEAGGAAYRRARFIPLGAAAGEVLGVVAILGGEDLREPPASPPSLPTEAEEEAQRRHELLRRFRRQTVALYGIDRLAGNSPAMRRARGASRLGGRQPGQRALGGTAGQRAAADGHRHPLRRRAGGRRRAGAAGLRAVGKGIDPRDRQRRQRDQSSGAAGGGGHVLLSPGRPGGRGDPGGPGSDAGRAAATLRLIAAAEQPLGELARRGRFREDLAAVLSTITIELPPLAQRREDLPLLAQVFLEELNARGGKQLAGFTPEAPGSPGRLLLAGQHRRVGADGGGGCHRGRPGPRSRPTTCPSGSAGSPRRPPVRGARKRRSCWTSSWRRSSGS